MKKWLFFGLLGVLVLWLVGVYSTLPGTEASLTTAAQALLAKPEHLAAFDEVKVAFRGQEAQLNGPVTTQADKDKAAKLISNEVRVSNWFGNGLNPVVAVNNGLEVNNTRSYTKPLPWLVASVFSDQIRLAGTIADAAAIKAANEAVVKLAPAGKFISQVSENNSARPAADWAATLKNIPDLKAAAAKNSNEGVIAVSACNGQWTVFTGNESDINVANALVAAATETSSVSAALTDIRMWQAAEREKARVAKLPLAVAAVTVVPTAVHAFGALGDPTDRKALIDGLTKASPGRKVEDHTTLSGDVKPGADWAASLASLPTKIDAGASAVLRSGEKALVWTGTGAADGIKKEFAAVLPAAITAAALHEPIDTYFKEKKAADEALAVKAKADAEAKMAADKAKAEADAKLAADKAKMDAAKPANPTVPQPAPTAPPQPTVPPAAPAPLKP